MKKTHARALVVIGVLVGALAGWLYWRYVGCLGGTCPIWSNPWISTGYGALLGWLLAGLIPVKREKNTDPNAEAGGREIEETS